MTQATSTSRSELEARPGGNDGMPAPSRVPGREPAGRPDWAWPDGAPQLALTRAIAYLHQRQRPDGQFPVSISPDPGMAFSRFDDSLFGTAMIVHSLSLARGSQSPQIPSMRRRATEFL